MPQKKASYNVATTEIMDYLKENMVTREEFNEFKQEVRTDFATKQDLKNELGKLRSDLIDYIDRRLLDLKTDLIEIFKIQDRKLTALVELLVAKTIITKKEGVAVLSIEIFPKGNS